MIVGHRKVPPTKEAAMTANASEEKNFDTTIADTILEQMGGENRLVGFIGAKIMKSKISVMMSFMEGRDGINACQVKYDEGQDLYTMTFYKLWGTKLGIIKEYDQVFCDQLVELFEETTGLMLHF